MEGRALPEFALDFHRSAALFDCGFDDIEADAAAGDFGNFRYGGEAGFEEPSGCDQFRVDATSIVCDSDLYFVRKLFSRYRDLAAVFDSVIDCVAYEMQQRIRDDLPY